MFRGREVGSPVGVKELGGDGLLGRGEDGGKGLAQGRARGSLGLGGDAVGVNKGDGLLRDGNGPLYGLCVAGVEELVGVGLLFAGRVGGLPGGAAGQAKRAHEARPGATLVPGVVGQSFRKVVRGRGGRGDGAVDAALSGA